MAVASVLGAVSAVGACGGGNSSTPASDAGSSGDDSATAPDATGDDSAATGDDDGGSAADVGPDIEQDPNVYPAMHHPLPQVTKGPGSVLDQMQMVTVTFANDPNAATYTAFDNMIAGTMWWQKALVPYGISPATVAATVVLPDTVSNTTSSDDQVQSYLIQEIMSGALPEPNLETLYVVYAPMSWTVTMGSEQSCPTNGEGFGGYHNSFEISVPGVDGGAPAIIAATYAMVFDCPAGDLANELAGVQQAASHEIAEAATDPRQVQALTYALLTDDAWSQYFGYSPANTGAELGDLCVNSIWTEGGYTFNPIYSNSAAALSQNPCQPATGVYYGAAIDTTKASLGGILSDGFVLVKPGMTTSVVVNVFSDDALPNELTLSVGGPSYYGALSPTIESGITATLSQTTAQNGDGVILTITAAPSTPTGGYVFAVRAQLNANDFNDWAAEVKVE